MEFICSLFCSILCCIIFFGAIGGGIFFLLKQNKTQDTVKDAPPTADTKEQDEDIEEPVQPEEETAKVDAVTSEPAAEESSTPADADAGTVEEPAPVPPTSPKAAGQTIIAFDDDDEDF